ncbi:uncharacterized protein LOC134247841 [Saccostrea cucullata]|uniref:uncharacterized protein LOC134247841 n=1 Tax=Saccostrea cuccullata TaxID=36930 RepID=UPI002ECFD5B4
MAFAWFVQKETSVQYIYKDCNTLHVKSLLQCASLSKGSKSVTFFYVPSSMFCHWDCTIIYCQLCSEKLTNEWKHYGVVRSVDGEILNRQSAHQCTLTNFESRPWIQIHLGGHYLISFVRLYNRQDGDGYRLHDVTLWVFQDDHNFTTCGFFKGPGLTKQVVDILCEDTVPSNIVRLQITEGSHNILCLCEVEVYIL